MEPERIDLSPLDPGGWERKATALVARARERRRALRRSVVVRGIVALALSAAAAAALWLSVPERAPARSPSILDWTLSNDPTEVLRYAQ